MKNSDQELIEHGLEKTLSLEGRSRWTLLANLASEHGYELEDRDSYRHDKNYLMKIRGRVIYLRDTTDHEYREVRKLLEDKAGTATSPAVIGNALTIGGSALGGAFLGYLLLRAGLPPLVMVPSIILPPCVGIYEMVRRSTKESKKLDSIDASLEKHKEHIFYNDEAIKQFLYGIHTRFHHV